MRTIQNMLAIQTWPLSFHNLDSCLRAVGLEYPLEERKPLTLFAPHDRAFTLFNQITIKDLLQNVELLRKLLQYHIVPLKLSQEDLRRIASPPLVYKQNQEEPPEPSPELPTLTNYSLHITVSHSLQVQDTDVLEPELATDNGIIHPISQILWPPDLTEASFLERKPAHIQ